MLNSPNHSDSVLPANNNRRRFVTSMVGAFSVLALTPMTGQAADEAVTLTPRPNPLMRVRLDMDLKGNVNVPNNPLVSREKETTVPIQSKALFDYEERYHRDGDLTSDARAIERFYHKANSTSQLNKTKSNIALRDSVRHVHINRQSLPETTYAVEDYFSHDEVRLLTTPVCSAAVDQLLPSKPVRVGDKYQPSEGNLTSLLNLSSIQKTDVEIEVVELTTETAKFQIKGDVQGSIQGVPTTIRALGKLTFDRRVGTSTWLAIALHETREIGNAEPGFDISATIKMVRQPLPKVVGLPMAPAKIAGKVPQNRMYVDLQSRAIDVAMLMDRRWNMMRDMPGSAMMRMIDNDKSIAQCNIRRLATLEAGKQWTLDAFQRDIQKTLGKQLSELVEADQRVSASGLRVLRVVAQGQVEGVPIQWVMLHFSDDSGRRVQATFTMGGDSVPTFAGADVQLANSLRFTAPTSKTNTETAAKPAARVSVAPSPSDLR